MELLKRVGELNRHHWLVDIFGPSTGVLLRLLMRSMNPFAIAMGSDSLIMLVWLAPLGVLGRLIGVQFLQGDPAIFYVTTAVLLAVGGLAMRSELHFMDRHNGQPRSLLDRSKAAD